MDGKARRTRQPPLSAPLKCFPVPELPAGVTDPKVRKANGYYFCITDKFSPENVNDTARETCLNWFFKIASIRELIPRLYPFLMILKRWKALHHE